MLILSQSAWKNTDMKTLFINDELLNLGNFDDIKNSETPRGEDINFDFLFENPFLDTVNLKYNENVEDSLFADCIKIDLIHKDVVVSIEPQRKQHDDRINIFAEKIKHIHFVSADRTGPVKFVEKTNLPQFLHVGPRGEHTINILANSNKLDNVSDILYLGNDAKSVLQQTIEWLGYILEGAKIDIKGREKESSVLYMLLNNKNSSNNYKPINVGFGYSYILPLIVTGLIAKSGETIIIENPEAHLHPRAQSKIAEFFTKVASCGVQVFIESHSEHILNGFRVNSLNHSIDVKHNELIIHYFDEEFSSLKLTMDEKGKIQNWPYGFFDQQENDLAEIFKYSLPL
ncbi:AAA family ATPase [Pedobacter mucosus]|uniref:AAA family ATPase n=1 Tax=Pedobacter mucosus TaxID=2895286 RepID=UPI001EE4D0E6|nr:DUF3696 domain-containing protein [Pedobacter mucosus]UKT62717.1 DUF3696 domain-containing protein [Pedobacter mucosus]